MVLPRNTRPRHILTGNAGEDEALRYLAGQGFSLLARNWRPGGPSHRLELDIVGRWENRLVFVEVKTRRDPLAETGEIAALRNFSPAKQRNMARAAQAFLAAHDAWDVPCRFDLVCVTFLPGQKLLDHYRDVVEFGKTLAGGNAAWQPW